MNRQDLLLKIRNLRSHWEKLPATDKNLRLAAVGFALIVTYGLLIYPLVNERISKLNYDLQKLAAREKNAAKAETRAVAPPPALGGKSPLQAETELKALKEQLDETRQETIHLKSRFVPLDDSLALNVLKGGLTSLAEAGDVEVVAIEHVYGRSEERERTPTPQLLLEAAQGNPFKRPLIEMRARASFRGLMQFLDGLSQLPYVVAPVGCDIKMDFERNPQTQAPTRQWLDVRIRFAV